MTRETRVMREGRVTMGDADRGVGRTNVKKSGELGGGGETQ